MKIHEEDTVYLGPEDIVFYDPTMPSTCPKCRRHTFFLECRMVNEQEVTQLYCHHDTCRYSEEI